MIKAGSGGDGCIAFRREAHNPRGGPCGGNGGRGGDIIAVADPQLSTLTDLHYQREYNAPSGQPGQGRDRYGRDGESIILRVPVGTIIYTKDGELLVDLNEPLQEFIVARGGSGGKGNIHFATSTNQAPSKAEPGEPGEERTLFLQLKLLADVGLLGYPNAGKSTFLSRISAARPKIANYPFTTLVPQLGVVRLPLNNPRSSRSLVVADIPGLIEGAHEGRGLGHQFLRHIERTRVLLHLIEVGEDESRDPFKEYKLLNEELRLFDENLAKKPQIAVITKIDLPYVREKIKELEKKFSLIQVPVYSVSAVTGEGLNEVLEKAFEAVAKSKQL